jgi:hypothetical protein
LYAYAGSGRRVGLGEYPGWHAHGAARFASREGMPRHVLAFHEGQAALVEFHMRDDQRVFIDPRLEVMGRSLMERYYDLAGAIAADSKSWQEQLDALPQPLAILVDHNSHYPLEATFLSSPQWRCAWFGHIAAVYVPKAARKAPRDRSGDLRGRHFAAGGATWGQEERAGIAIDEAKRELREAAVLMKIAQTMGKRSTDRGVDRRLLVLNAMRLARQSRDRLPERSAPLAMLARASLQLYGYPSREPGQSAPLELLGVARSRFLFRRCREIGDSDFSTLSDEYTLITALGDIDAAYPVGVLLVDTTPPDERGSRFLVMVRQTLISRQKSQTVLPDSVHDQKQLVDRLMQSRRFQEAQDTFWPVFEKGEAMDEPRLSWETRDRIATACLLSGNPQRARKVWGVVSREGDNKSLIETRVGFSFLVEDDHERAMNAFKNVIGDSPDAAEARCGLAICYLELGDARSVMRECEIVLADTDLPEGIQEFCERLHDFARRNLGEE